ncbi:MAG: stage III sporulation protein AB [Clostridia bacterium]|nr:stage III sporulation protein AB [Clostridia bacterium]
MGSMDAAVMALAGSSAIGFLLADGEQKRLGWVVAMRRCLLRLGDIIRYERCGISALLRTIELTGSAQERALTRLLHACAAEMERRDVPRLSFIYAEKSAKLAEYGVLSNADREAFEQVMSELGNNGLREQLRLIETADGRLLQREAALRKEGAARARLIRTLGVCCGAGMFLVLV